MEQVLPQKTSVHITMTSTYGMKKKKADMKPLDLCLVVGMFLTGFDSKKLNTLYVDKNMEYHGLLQAFSAAPTVC